jgi:hypothetical protein
MGGQNAEAIRAGILLGLYHETALPASTPDDRIDIFPHNASKSSANRGP